MCQINLIKFTGFCFLCPQMHDVNACFAPQVVTKTFHSAGIVVPVDKNDVGYRELPETDGEVVYCLRAVK